MNNFREQPEEKRERRNGSNANVMDGKEAHSSNEAKLNCDECQLNFTRIDNFKRHMEEQHKDNNMGLKCPKDFCGKPFRTNQELQEHRKECKFTCPFCSKEITRNGRFKGHMKTCPAKRGPTNL